MIRKMLLTGLALAAAAIVVSSIPDLARYIKIRSM